MKKIILLLLAFILTACSFGTRSELDTQPPNMAGLWHHPLSLFA